MKDLRATSLVVLLAIGSSCRHAPPGSEPTVAGAAATSASANKPAAPSPTPVAAATVAVPNSKVVRSQADCPEGMLFIPAADFSVTMPDVWDPARKPRKQRLQVEAFCIDRTEMAMSSFPKDRCGHPDRNCMLSAAHFGPATCISPKQAECACQQGTEGVVKRLPTDPEWILAALGTDGRRYPWGNDPYPEGYKIGDNFCPPQAQLPAQEWLCRVDANTLDRSPFGVIGMSGNGWEMTSTCSPTSDARPSACIIRGGDVNYGPLDVPGTALKDQGPFSFGADQGFRCATSERRAPQ